MVRHNHWLHSIWMIGVVVDGFSIISSRNCKRRISSVVELKDNNRKNEDWFVTNAVDALDSYNDQVKALYVRQVVVETYDMANMAMELYLKNATSVEKDAFGQLANDLSSSLDRVSEGGGEEEERNGFWIHNPFHPNSNATATNFLLPANDLFEKRPKSGDIVKVYNSKQDQWHVISILNVWMESLPQILRRNKLKGSGVLPQVPSATKGGAYHVITTGCQMNVADSERLSGVLENECGMTITDNSKDANVVVLNTCSIRDHAEQKVYDALGPFAARKRNGEALAIVVAGCVAQQEGSDLLRRIPEIDIVMGPQYVTQLSSLLQTIMEGGHQVVATDPLLLPQDDYSQPVRGHSIRAWVNIIHGCNEHCTYCVVPNVRGVEQSRSYQSILEEINNLAKLGYREITLLGQNIDAYGRDMKPKRTFSDLLLFLEENVSPEIKRIRYVTSHPRYFSPRVIDVVASPNNRICECFHMPFQAGDDDVLAQMRRGYTYDSYMNIIHKIKAASPDASICGDVIVGFPGESDEAFEQTLKLMEEVKFDNLNTFAYSPRPNTEAAKYDNQISEEVKKERLQQVQRLATQHAMERSQRYLNTQVEILVEDINPKNPNQIMGRTRQGRQVYCPGTYSELKGQLLSVRITEARPWSLIGTIIDDDNNEGSILHEKNNEVTTTC